MEGEHTESRINKMIVITFFLKYRPRVTDRTGMLGAGEGGRNSMS